MHVSCAHLSSNFSIKMLLFTDIHRYFYIMSHQRVMYFTKRGRKREKTEQHNPRPIHTICAVSDNSYVADVVIGDFARETSCSLTSSHGSSKELFGSSKAAAEHDLRDD